MRLTPAPTQSRRVASLALAVTVGVVLADSSVVILALPDILARYDVSVAAVAWVLTAYNLVLGLLAVPAAMWARRAPRGMFAGGTALFSAASVGCAMSDGLGWLVAARSVQAAGGALAVCAALVLMPAVSPSPAAATRAWARAGVLGMALGPAVGGALTQLLSWQAIFVAQVPVVLAVLAVRGPRAAPASGPGGRPHVLANAALVLVSAGLTAALFLLVLLMINGWGMRPLAAAVAVTVMPAAAIAAGRVAGQRGSDWARGIAGAVGVAGGLAALGLMPGAGVGWTVLPQMLVGLGLGLAVPAITQAALAVGEPGGVHGGVTVASRHLGVVLGILLLTPLFVADLNRQQTRAEDAVTAALLDSRVDAVTKLALTREGARVLAASEGRVPDLGPAFDAVTPSEGDRADFADLRRSLTDRIARAATASVARSFLAAALLSALALLPLVVARRRGGGL